LTRFAAHPHARRVSDPASSPADAASVDGPSVYAKFETELQVRPDDIDMYQHVHSSRYMDYVLAARFDQMDRCYRMPMAAFQARGFGWFMAATQMNFKRPLGLGDRFVVRTWIEKFSLIGVKVQFQIERRPEGKLSCDGWFDYVMVALDSGRPVRLPPDIREKYAI
jgi:acyl-CoA thioester hydrolase/thioesterase-3